MATATTARVALILLVVLAAGLLGVLLSPFASPFFIAAVLAGAVHPWMESLSRRLGGRRQLAGTVLLLALVVVVLVPLGWLGTELVRQVIGAVGWLREALQSEGTAGLVSELPGWARPLVQRALDGLPHGLEELQSLAAREGGRAAVALGGILGTAGSFLFKTAMFLIAFFFFLVDGPRLVAWGSAVLPLKRGQLAELLGDFRNVTVSVLLSTIATAGVQTVLAVIGYVVAGVPNALFFAFVTFVLGLVPAVGATVVVLAMALLQFVTGHHVAGVALALYGLLVVGMIDNVVKPLLMRGRLAIHGAVIFFALLGGLAVFGPVGLAAGPLIVAFFIAAVRMFGRDFGEN
ncbi:AI-2E family transporter [Anaeromyxobacter paludicola]|uniref:AI-2E family transporter n=1 Tax=Anaeromyxobacter paludicola TaxID=2918171 RepID=A0ABM7XA96_9BACT|nr:AI-2E family transporter [Anaeromyxobacter paludicola]BDG08769.1 AI-2E family transporter [Anaeromyxobacter paludicola]